MSFDGKMSHQAAVTDTKKTDWQVFLSQWIGMLAVVAFFSLSYQLGTVRDTIAKNNDLTHQQIAVTRSMHHVNELATAYIEGRKASQAAEDAGVPVEEQRTPRPFSLEQAQGYEEDR